jgi:hypothetical protein
MKYLKFNKEADGRWFIDLPSWDGNKSDLEMVLGADTMLEIFSQGEGYVEICVHDKEYDSLYKLYFDKFESGGAWYLFESPTNEFKVWLCFVTKFVFGYFPKIIYLG